LVTATDIRLVLAAFSVDPDVAEVEAINAGHINKTFKVVTASASFILQRINNSVFKEPEVIASNLEYTRRYLSEQHPEYLFISPLPAMSGKTMHYDGDGFPWRLYPFIENTFTVNDVQNVDQAYKAAAAFGSFGRLMKGCDLTKFCATIPRFHDLSLRYNQFGEALANSKHPLKEAAKPEIESALKYRNIVTLYLSLIKTNTLQPGIFHNDTKINNVLFDRTTGNAVGVIDLDTVMEGYFIYDIGDLIRTLVSPVSEEEIDVSKIVVRKEFYNAVVEGYMSEFPLDSGLDKACVSFAGIMMTYIMALRFLADYLRGNTYYHITYPEQNLVRARNQLRLVELLQQNPDPRGWKLEIQ
jgi:Ser/Thr protein kinase RdoA (MazF antagonist)